MEDNLDPIRTRIE
jgi:hypothetical protein